MIALPLEDYVRGVNEVFFDWEAAALETQAIAARSFGVYKNLIYGPEAELSEERKELCWCHLFASINDQVYKGWRTEIGAASDRWVAAVEATEGMVMVHPASAYFDIAQTFYSAANGGASENSEDVFIDAVPYLRSVPDPWTPSAAGNPYASWEHRFDEDQIAAAFGAERADGIHIVERFESGTPSRIDIWTRTAGETAVTQMKGNELAATLGLTGRHVDDVTYGAIEPLVGDYTGDGTPDVAMLLEFNKAWWVANAASESLAMSPWANLALHIGWQEPVTGDFTGDGRSDVAVYNSDTGRWSVGVSDGAFEFDRWAGHGESPEQWTDAVVGDFDGDGLDDIAHHNPASGSVRVFRSTGSAFAAKRWHRFDPAGSWAAVLPGDFDGDGRDDLAFLDEATGQVTVLFSMRTTFRAYSWSTLDPGVSLTALPGDVNADGRDDLIAHDPVSGEWSVAVAAEGRIAAPARVWATTNLTWSLITPGDYDGDGDADVAVYDEGARRWKVLRSLGATFTVAKWGKSPGNGIFTDAFATDRDGDGDTDLLLFSEVRRKWWLLESDGDSFAQRGIGRLFG